MSDETAQIRPYRDSDGAGVIELARQLQSNEHALFERMTPPGDIGEWYLEAITRQCLDNDGRILVAEHGGRVVGYATVLTRIVQDEIDETEYEYAQIGDLVVSADARRQGLGARLIEACERIATDAGARWLRISVLARNEAAVQLYQARGFAPHLMELEKPLERE